MERISLDAADGHVHHVKQHNSFPLCVTS